MERIDVDGSYLEGGGQILRTAVGLAAATGRPCRVHSIRKGRRNPGLAAQHLAGVRAVARLCNGELQGAELGSQEVQFRPARLQPPARLNVSVGTAGSVSLVLQGLMIPLAAAGRNVEVTVEGGTHVMWSPVAEYFGKVFAYFLGRMGVQVRVLEVRPGFYPKGGGSLRVGVRPEGLRPLSLTSRGGEEGVSADSLATTDLREARVAERQLEGVAEVLEVGPARPEYVNSASTGTAVHVLASYANCRLGASALGKRGKPAEKVGREAAESLRRAMATGACLDEHMADQILPYLALAGGHSEVTVARITDHCRTNTWVIEKFLPVDLELDGEARLIRCRC